MEMLPVPLVDPETYSPWSNIYTVGLQVAASCAQAGFLDWASNLTQLRHLKAQKRPRPKRAPRPAPRPAPRLPSKYARRLFIWGFIGINVAVSITWARAADEATATSIWRLSVASLRAPGGLIYMVENFGLSAHDLRQGRWWTLLTCSISHVAPAHLILNMCEFYMWASRCFDLGLGPGSVAGLMLGSAVCCGGVGLANEVPGRRSKHMGASGIVSGLRVAAILLEPVMGFRIPGVFDVRWPLFTTVLTVFAIDLFGALSQRRALTAPSMTSAVFRGVPKTLVGYAGHLGGAAFGAAYWYFSLRSRFGTL